MHIPLQFMIYKQEKRFLLCRLLIVGPVLKWLALCMYLLLCRLLVVGPVLKWLALFMYLCMYVFITVPTTYSRPSIEMVAFITVPTTCSRPSIEMVGFMYVCIYVFLRRQCPDHTFRYFWLKFRM